MLLLSDKHYSQVPVANLPVLSATVNARPTTAWKEPGKEIYVCTGASVLVPVINTGKPPFTIRYSVNFQDSRELKTFVTDKEADSILLDSLTLVGIYEIHLLEADDFHGCKYRHVFAFFSFKFSFFEVFFSSQPLQCESSTKGGDPHRS